MVTNPQLEPIAVCVLGMHRSGTSAVARLLNLVGVELGPAFRMMKPNEHNPRGYWEHDELTGINDEILLRHGGNWHQPPLLASGWESSPDLADMREKATAIIRRDFKGVSLWGWKDPRNSLTLPFWLALEPSMRCVICLRNPSDVAASLRERDGFSFEKSGQLWVTYVGRALRHTAKVPRAFVFYEDLVRSPLSSLHYLATFLGKLTRPAIAEIELSVLEFIEEGLQHYSTAAVDVIEDPKQTYPAKSLYLTLQANARLLGLGTAGGRSNNEDDDVHEALSVFGDLSLTALEQLEKFHESQAQLREADRELDELRAERAWISEQASHLDELATKLAERMEILEQTRNEKDMLRGELEAIKSTNSWRFALLLRRVRQRVAPDGTRRERTYWLLLRGFEIWRLEGFRAFARKVWIWLLGRTGGREVLEQRAQVASPRKERNRPRSIRVVRSGQKQLLKHGNHKTRFSLYVSSRGNYFFHEITELLARGLLDLGFEVEKRSEEDGFAQDGDWHLVIAPHEFFELGHGRAHGQKNLPSNLILVNTEQPSTQWFSLASKYFPAAYRIWDMSHSSARTIAAEGIRCDYLPLGYLEDFDLLGEVIELPEHYGTCFLEPQIRHRSFLHDPLRHRPIDVLFVGSLSPRRERFFANAAPVLSKYETYFYFWDAAKPIIEDLNTYMNTSTVVGLAQRSKIVLNVHRGTDTYFEWQRIVMHGIWQRALVVSEPCGPATPFQSDRDYVTSELEDFCEAIDFYLSEPDGVGFAEAISRQGFNTLTTSCLLSPHLRQLILSLYVPIPVSQSRFWEPLLGRSGRSEHL